MNLTCNWVAQIIAPGDKPDTSLTLEYSRSQGKFMLIWPLIARFMGPTWGPSGADRTQVGIMLAPWTLLPGTVMYIMLCLMGSNKVILNLEILNLEFQFTETKNHFIRKLPRATTNVQKNKSYVGLFISYVGLFISYVGLFISYVGLIKSYVGL